MPLPGDQATRRAQRRARVRRLYHTINAIFRIDPREHWAFLTAAVKWVILGSGVGVLAGTASAVFLIALALIIELFTSAPALLFLLPVIGFVIGLAYYYYAGAAARGNNLVIEEVNLNRNPIPLRMAPMVLIGTLLTHLGGGSAGREGTAVQMGGSLADWLHRSLRLRQEDRPFMIMAGISGGFSSVFGTPLAGFVFGLEVRQLGRLRYDGILPCLVAALVGDWVTRAWGASHAHYPQMAATTLDLQLLFKVALAGVAFGLTSLLFIELTHGIRYVAGRLIAWPPLRPAIGGVAVIGMTLLVGSRDYLNLGLPLIQHSLDGTGVSAFAFLLKLIFTSVTIGSGFVGGEVTPLFAIGSALGYLAGVALGVDPAWMAAIGFVAVFAGASNTPLACMLMGIEIVGGAAPLYLMLGCFVAYLASGHRGIYTTQQVGWPKVVGADARLDENLEALAARRRGWLPALARISAALPERPVRAIMTVDPVAVKPTTPLVELIDIALRRGIRTLPVIDAQRVLVGIITDDNLLRCGGLGVRLGLVAALSASERVELIGGAAAHVASDIMTTPVVTIAQTARIRAAAAVMIARELKRLPVVDQAGRLVGMLTRSDVLRELLASPNEAPWSVEAPAITALGAHPAVEQVMTRDILYVAPDSSIRDVACAMLDAAQQRVVVVDSAQRVLGIITDGDLLARMPSESRAHLFSRFGSAVSSRALDALGAVPLTAAAIMTTPVVTVQVQTPVHAALRLIMEHRLKRLPVVDAGGRMIGLVGRAAILRALLASL
jgi:H+/Cl- antiporter ClcA/CBS domain-containing protein